MSGRLSISLTALAANYKHLQQACGAKVAGVVKANAYGLGLQQVAQKLVSVGCSDFFVATLNEGLALRKSLPGVCIYVLEGVRPETLAPMLEMNLTPVLNSHTQVRCWAGSDAAAALHIDTGMQRLGLPLDDVAGIAADINFDISLLMSHFARADEQDPTAVQQQEQRFESAMLKLKGRFADATVSMSNSAAALSGGLGDGLVRGGIALYGGNPFSDAPNPMQPVVRLEGQILQLREVPAGTPVGYGGSFTASKPTRLATVGVGYADGLPRLLSNCGRAFVADAYCPIVGRVSMDMLHLDVSETPQVQEGDWAELVGSAVGLDEVAGHAQTLSYEVLTQLNAARRLEQIYTEGL